MGEITMPENIHLYFESAVNRVGGSDQPHPTRLISLIQHPFVFDFISSTAYL